MAQVTRHQIAFFQGPKQLLARGRIRLAARRTLLQKCVGVNLAHRHKRQFRLYPVGQNLLGCRKRRLPTGIGIVRHKNQALSPGAQRRGIGGIPHDFIDLFLGFLQRNHRQSTDANVQPLGREIGAFVGVQIPNKVVQTIRRIERETGYALVDRDKIVLIGQTVFVVVGSVSQQNDVLRPILRGSRRVAELLQEVANGHQVLGSAAVFVVNRVYFHHGRSVVAVPAVKFRQTLGCREEGLGR